MANRLLYEFKCSICHRTATALVMPFSGPGKDTSARYQDCAAEYVVDDTRERACPSCYRTGQTLEANGVGKTLICHEHRGDPLGYVIDMANAMDLPTKTISEIREEIYDVLVGPAFEGSMDTSPWVEFEGRTYYVGSDSGVDLYDGWKICLCLGELEGNLDLRYYWHPYHSGRDQNSEGLILNNEGVQWTIAEVYQKVVELAKAIREIINKNLGNTVERPEVAA